MTRTSPPRPPCPERARIVCMRGDLVEHGPLLQDAFRSIGIDATLDPYDFFPVGTLTRRRVADIRRRLRRRHDDALIVFCPGAREYLIDGDHLSVQFSGYAGVTPTRNLVVLPHPWDRAAPDPAAVPWPGKPSLTIGFMGSAYRTSRAARMAARLPAAARRWLIQGGHARSAMRYATLEAAGVPIRYMPAFPRFEALDMLAASVGRDERAVFEEVDTVGFDGSAASRDAFARNLLWSTYVLCPRGCENYSFRVFEALRFGRVPVIVDTAMMLPDRARLERLCVIVDHDALDTMMERIVADYDGHDAAGFAARQQAALDYTAELLSPTDLAARLHQAVEAMTR